MHAQHIALVLFASGAFAAPSGMKVARDDCSSACMDAYNTCRSQADANRAGCASEYATCLGYSSYDDSGSLVTPTACSTTAAATVTSTSGAMPVGGACSSSSDCASGADCYGVTSGTVKTCGSFQASCTSDDQCATNTCNSGLCNGFLASSLYNSPSSTAATSATSIPGGCNPAHPGSCPSSYFSTITTVTASATNAPCSTITETIAAAPAAVSPSVVVGAGWTIKDLIRYCSADGSGCDYNFVISTNDEHADERCTVTRMPGSGATTESFYDIPCTAGSVNFISWGYSDQFGVDSAFAVLTVTNHEEKRNAFFGIPKVNGGAVTLSSPAGSGSFGDIGPQPVYTF